MSSRKIADKGGSPAEADRLMGENYGLKSKNPDNGKYDIPLSKDEKDADPKKNRFTLDEDTEGKGGQEWKDAWYNFSQDTSFSALKQVTEPQPFVVRRFCWALLFIIGTICFLVQCGYSIQYYMLMPVSVDVKINYNDTIVFPAVTICNENAFRSSVAYANGQYELITNLFAKNKNSHFEDSTNRSAFTLEDLYLSAKHLKDDLIFKCEWNSKQCSENDFDITLTDFGVCYTFNSGRKSEKKELLLATQTGTHGGLRVQLNIEQYEYMEGPNDGAGIKLHIHDADDIALVGDHGLAVPTGSHGFVALQIIREHALKPPHGKCNDSVTLDYFKTYTMSTCMVDCKQNYLIKKCGCRDIYMPAGENNVSVCTLHKYETCMLQAIETFNGERDLCHCPTSCHRTLYAPLVSYLSTSNFDIDNLLSNSHITNALQKRYIQAREATQRVHPAVIEKDTRLINNFAQIVEQIDDSFHSIIDSVSIVKGDLKTMFKEMRYRMKYHLDRGLHEVKFIIEHDFIRGWTVFEERVFDYVAANYNDVHLSFERTVKWIQENIPKEDKSNRRSDVWFHVQNMLEGRSHLVRLAKENITQADIAYETGKPLLTYETTIDRRYDMSYISVDLLTRKAGKRKEYFDEIMHGLNMSEESLSSLIKIGKDFVSSGNFDESGFQLARNLYERANKKLNYRMFLYKDRIVEKPNELIDEIISNFLTLQNKMLTDLDTLQVTMDSISSIIKNMTSTVWITIHNFGHMARDYQTDRQKNKTDLSMIITSSEMETDLRLIKLQFTELRSRARDLRDQWRILQESYGDIWENMVLEETTKDFYKLMEEDYSTFMNDSNQADFFYKIFSFMTRKTESLLKSHQPNELLAMLNAGFHSLDLKQKMIDINEHFHKLRTRCDINGIFGDNDETFLLHFNNLFNSLTSFLKGNEINQKFYRENFMQLDVFMKELSYEEITQQPAYDMTQLLSDIGGNMGLFIGGSALSIFEIFDVLGHNGARRALKR